MEGRGSRDEGRKKEHIGGWRMWEEEGNEGGGGGIIGKKEGRKEGAYGWGRGG